MTRCASCTPSRTWVIILVLSFVCLPVLRGDELEKKLKEIDAKIEAKEFDDASKRLSELFLEDVESLSVIKMRAKLYEARNEPQKERMMWTRILELADYESDLANTAQQRLRKLNVQMSTKQSHNPNTFRRRTNDWRMRDSKGRQMIENTPELVIMSAPAEKKGEPEDLPKYIPFMLGSVEVSEPAKTDEWKEVRKVSFTIQPMSLDLKLPNYSDLYMRIIFFDEGDGYVAISKIPEAKITKKIPETLSPNQKNPVHTVEYRVPLSMDLKGREYIGFTVEFFDGKERIGLAGHPLTTVLFHQILVEQ